MVKYNVHVVSLIVPVLFVLHSSAETRKKMYLMEKYGEVCHVSKTYSPYFLPVIMHMDSYINNKRDILTTLDNNICFDVFTSGSTSETVIQLTV